MSWKNTLTSKLGSKMFNLGFFGSHNASLAISFKGEVLEVVELERLINVKNAAFFYWGNHTNIVELLTEIKNYFEKKYNVKKYHNVIYNSVDKEMWKIFPADNYEWLPHHQAHAYSGLYQSSYQKALIISFDGGSDEGYFNVYLGDKSKSNILEKIYVGKKDYAISYMMPSHFISDIKQEWIYTGNLVYAGKIMGLAGYGKVREEYIAPLKQFYFSNITDNINEALARFINIFTPFGITSDKTRLEGSSAVDLATTNQYVFEQLFEEETSFILEKYSHLPLIISGGCGLNILHNTKLAKKRETFITPNPNDTGLAVGLVCSKIKPHVPVDTTYLGSEVWDRNNLSKFLYERKGTKYNVEELVNNLLSGQIIGIVRGRSEHGPRALGNRSIICDPTIAQMKDTLNAKVKGREYYRPFAPVVRLQDVNKYFKWDKESRWMSFCPEVREEYRDVLKAITHIDGTARVQTVTQDQNPFLYSILTEMDKRKGIGVILNTSFNVAGKPILNTYEDAFWVLDNKEMDGVILEDYYFKKKL